MNISSDSKLWVRALSVTAIAAAGLLLSGCSLLGQVSDLTGGGDPTTGTDGGDGGGTSLGEHSAFDLVPGDCFAEPDEGDTVENVNIVDCAGPHPYEAFASIQMTEDEYPGDSAAEAEAKSACDDAFVDYVGISSDDSIYDATFFYPTQQTWDDPDLQDREILCLVRDDEDGDITGSVKGANK